MGKRNKPNPPKVWPERCSKCRFRADSNAAHNCDYAWFTGKTRSAQVKRKKDLTPERCPLFEEGPRIDARHDEWWWNEVEKEYGKTD